MSSLKKLVQSEKELKDYPRHIERVVKMITLDNSFSQYQIVGTGIGKMTPWYGDIDIYNEVHSPYSLKKTAQLMSDNIVRIVRDVFYDADVYYSDFKCGYDNDGAFHWTLAEILNQEKNGVSLQEAMMMKNHIVKLDVIYNTGDRFLEMTTFFNIFYNKDTPMNDEKVEEKKLIKSLQEDIDHYLNEEVSYFKAIKRLLSLFKVSKKGTNEEIDFISRIMNSVLGYFSEIIARLEGILLLMKSREIFVDYPLYDLVEYIGDIKLKLNSMGVLNIPGNVNKLLDKVLENVAVKDKPHLLEAINQIEELIKILKKVLNRETKKVIEENKFKFNYKDIKGGSIADIIKKRTLESFYDENVRHKKEMEEDEERQKQKQKKEKQQEDEIKDFDKTKHARIVMNGFIIDRVKKTLQDVIGNIQPAQGQRKSYETWNNASNVKVFIGDQEFQSKNDFLAHFNPSEVVRDYYNVGSKSTKIPLRLYAKMSSTVMEKLKQDTEKGAIPVRNPQNRNVYTVELLQDPIRDKTQ